MLLSNCFGLRHLQDWLWMIRSLGAGSGDTCLTGMLPDWQLSCCCALMLDAETLHAQIELELMQLSPLHQLASLR